MIVDFHRGCLADERRLDIHLRALQAIIRPGMVFADIGSGPGLFACLACRLGAARAYAIDVTDIVHTVPEVAAANGCADRVVAIQADARELQLPEKVDVMWGDILGAVGIEDNFLEIYAPFADRNLAPGGHIAPMRIEVFAAPWHCPAAFDPIDFWNRPHAGLDFAPIRPLAANAVQNQAIPKGGGLAPPARVWDLDVLQRAHGYRDASLTYTIDRPGRIHGLATWFRAHLAPGIVLDTAPTEPELIWRQGLMALEEPLDVRPGDALDVTLTATPSATETLMGWRGRLTRAGDVVAEFTHSDHLGPRHALNVLAQFRRGGRPRLSRDGEAALVALRLLDGVRDMTAIAAELRRARPERFPTQELALDFIARLARRYGYDAPAS